MMAKYHQIAISISEVSSQININELQQELLIILNMKVKLLYSLFNIGGYELESHPPHMKAVAGSASIGSVSNSTARRLPVRPSTVMKSSGWMP